MTNEGKIAGAIYGALIGQAVRRKYGFISGALVGFTFGDIFDLALENN
jgi:hypothetical protein